MDRTITGGHSWLSRKRPLNVCQVARRRAIRSYNSAMRLALVTTMSLCLTVAVFGQTLTLKAPAPQYVSVEGTASVSTVAPGGRVTLWADVTPKARIHVYAAGAKDFTPVALVMTPRQGMTLARPIYPASQRLLTAGVIEPVPVYSAPFRIAQPVTIARTVKAGETLTLAGAVNYQACDDRVCYPPASIAVTWTLKVK